MSTSLEFHAATGDEVAAAHRNVFDLWSQGRPLDEHVQFRLNSPKHRLARWYVGTLEGRVVVSLGCYPLRFHLRGQQVPGFAIGSVYTVAEFRRRGYAAQLLGWVEDEQRREGAALSLLYSDIDPGYYARLGYVACPSFEGWRDLADFLPPEPSTYRLVEMLAADQVDALAKLYADYHGAMPLAVARDREYWAALFARFVDDRFFALTDGRGDRAGYIRLGCQSDRWIIRDYALADQSDELAEQLYAATLRLGRASRAVRLGGWLPEISAAKRIFHSTPRCTEITMLKSLCGGEPWDDALLQGTSRFCEIDHV